MNKSINDSKVKKKELDDIKKENKTQIAKHMLDEKIDIALIAKITGLSHEEIGKLK